MTTTIVPLAAVITRVKIEKTKIGDRVLYLLRSQELGRMAVAVTREVLTKIAARQSWTVVKAWA